MSDLAGMKVGPYEIAGVIGAGGMATVYRGRQASMQRDVAIKVIESALARTPEFIRRFEREAQTVAALSHTNILKVFDYGRQGDLVYIVMELLAGGSLEALIRHTGALPLDKATRILRQIASALDYAHGKGLVHRDLKPQNVLFDEAGNALLTDFGVAKFLSESTALTQGGVAMGTPAYMAPEQWRGEPLDGRADNYALGVLLYQMLSGRLPFEADTPYSMMYMHLQDPPPALCTSRPDLPASVEAVILQALAKDREERFGTAHALADAFEASLAGREPVRVRGSAQALLPRPLPGSGAPSIRPTLPRKARSALAALSVLALAGVIGGTALVWGPRAGEPTPSAAQSAAQHAAGEGVALAALESSTPPPPRPSPSTSPSPTASITASPTASNTLATPDIPATVAAILMATGTAAEATRLALPSPTPMPTSTLPPTVMAETPDVPATVAAILMATNRAAEATRAAQPSSTPTPPLPPTALVETPDLATLVAALLGATRAAETTPTATPTASPTPSSAFTPTATPTPTLTPSPNAPCTAETSVRDSVLVRVGPGPDRAVLMYLPAGQPYRVLGQARSGEGPVWWKLDIPEQAEAWVARPDVQAAGGCEQLEALATPPIRTRAPRTATPTPTLYLPPPSDLPQPPTILPQPPTILPQPPTILPPKLTFVFTPQPQVTIRALEQSDAAR